MPIYYYECSKCGHAFDDLLKVKDLKKPTKSPCEKCGEKAVFLPDAAPAIGYRMTAARPSSAYKEVMRNIKKKHRLHNIPD